MPAQTCLYFVAIIPPRPLYDDLVRLKHYMADKYSSKASLRSPPHMTIHMPFKWRKDKEESLLLSLRKFQSPVLPFEVCLEGFSCFEPRVIYVDIVPNKQLNDLQEAFKKFARGYLNLFNSNYKDRPFHPHVTIAFRDLKKEQFVNAWQEFANKEFSSSFRCERLSLLKHDGKRWHVSNVFSLGV